MCRCLILLSTYNGEKYLPELLESVLAQKDIYVDILARDDGSTDKTVEILKKYDRVKTREKFSGLDLESGYKLRLLCAV